MDLDIFPGILADRPPDLLTNSSDRRLTDGGNASAEAVSRTGNTENPNHAGAVITKIEDIFDSIADSILDEKKELVIQLKARSRLGIQARDPLAETIKSLPKSEPRTIKFPSKSPQEAWKFGIYRSSEIKIF